MSQIEQAVAVLNDMLKLDPICTNALVKSRIPCNESVENHPTIVCTDGTVGLLGVLNGIFADPDYRICAVLEGDSWGEILAFDLVKTDDAHLHD